MSRPPTDSRQHSGQRRWPVVSITRDTPLRLFSAAAALLGLGLLLLIVFSTLQGALAALPALANILSSSNWAPLSGQFGMLAMITASLAASLLALLLAAPLAILLAVWLALYCPPRLQGSLRALYELMAGIPSVVYGLWGLILLVPLISRLAPPGANLLSAALVLALMILPYGVLLIDSRLRSLPLSLRQAGLACGLSTWGCFRAIYWPLARPGAVNAMILQFGRALGETMAVLMVAGNVVQLPDSLLAPVRTLTANIALEMGYAADQHRAALFLSGLLLLVMAMLLMWRRPEAA